MKSGVYHNLVDVCSVNKLRMEPHDRNVGKPSVDSLFANKRFRCFTLRKLYSTLCCCFCQFGDWFINCEVLQTAYDVLAGCNVGVLSAQRNVVVWVVRRECLYDAFRNCVVSADDCVGNIAACKEIDHVLV